MMYSRLIKPFLDLLIATSICFIAFPVILTVSIFLFYSNNGRVFFKQERPGKGGKIFKLIKFKTMSDQRDSTGKLLPDNQRLTSIGKFVRSTSFDELPQLWNVLKGDMSIVGPRPLLVEYLPLYNDFQWRRHEVKPGITGWAQVNGRNAISWERKFELDIWYVNHFTFILDMEILLLTVKKVFIREGISGDGSVTMKPFTGTEKSN